MGMKMKIRTNISKRQNRDIGYITVNIINGNSSNISNDVSSNISGDIRILEMVIVVILVVKYQQSYSW